MYGTHPFFWYFFAGVPALSGILFPILVYDLFFGAWDRPKRKVWAVVACYVVAHSFSEHKEFRFLLPILPMICLLCGTRIQNLVDNFSPSRKRQLVYACAVPNLVAVLYLGLFHQRAPIEVNRAILKTVSSARNPPSDPVRVHYLMGCHSTPLLSHLHDPPTEFEPWYLDCSPECRKNPTIDCESDAFSKDPDSFVKQTYYCNDGEENDDQTCSTDDNGARDVPHYIVCNDHDLQKMEPRLASMDMIEISRFVHSIDGIEFFGNSQSSDAGPFGGFLSLSYNEVVLLQRL